jgi:hypothetical protein
MTLDQLVNAGFPIENWPEDLPQPGEANITEADMGGKTRVYRYSANINGQAFAMEVVVDGGALADPAEGVGFMLNQFAYLWRTNKPGIAVQPDGACRRINF